VTFKILNLKLNLNSIEIKANLQHKPNCINKESIFYWPFSAILVWLCIRLFACH